MLVKASGFYSHTGFYFHAGKSEWFVLSCWLVKMAFFFTFMLVKDCFCSHGGEVVGFYSHAVGIGCFFYSHAGANS